ncbi:HNH endonuclease family protein [Streptomyces sp. NBC_00249]|uniref:HNH endonuclease family protein n=1 Tax=Streptomyces sp. NBC_00249 TaxID=2975690 RepID=UPI00224C844E|nr:HNH endonuclease family protein [Streptomyces sp. NBC_00249]MCX5197855.1 HNH endonuclease family protein [Streptomyces sp. NBC_00249]
MGRRAPLIAATAALLLLTACHHEDPATARAGAAALVAGVPLTSPGFPPDASRAREELAGLKVEWGRNWETYKREDFGRYWSDETDAVGGRNGCDTRDDVLRRDLRELRQGDRNPCVVVSGMLHDPYTGKELPYSYRRASQIQTDHVVALGAAWRGGAYAWTAQRRLEYANDLDGLLAVDKQTNYDKSSKTADKWRPPAKGYWCEYARRYTGIKAKYRLSVTPPEKLALEELLATCG